MAYDDTSFNGDLLVDEYDDHNNFIGTNTPMGYYAYHILGDGFDLMAEQCSRFMNDFSILSADASSLDKFWGVSYNMPRPSIQYDRYVLYEDEGILENHNDAIYSNTSAFVRTSSVTNIVLDRGKSTAVWVGEPIVDDFEMQINLGTIRHISVRFVNEENVQYRISSTESDSSNIIHISSSGLYTIRKIGNTLSVSRFGRLIRSIDVSGESFHIRLFSANGTQGRTTTASFKKLKVTLLNPTEQFPMSDEEYRAYLYLRNCRLMTREDLLINFEKVFGLDDCPIVFSEETNYLETSDHLNYEAEDTTSSNLHKRDDDTTLHFVTDFSNDETTELIESGLSVVEETITVINIPYQNWNKDFLEYMEQYISVKGNIKIKEYTL